MDDLGSTSTRTRGWLRVLVAALTLMGAATFTISPASAATFNVSYGQTINGSISVPGESNTYRWTGRTGERLSIDRITGSGSLRMTLSVGARVVWNNEYYTERWVELPQDGTYSLTISYGPYNYTGSYSFAINSVRVPQTFAVSYRTTIDAGVPQAGMGDIELPGSRDSYTFAGRRGERLSIDRISGSGSLRMKLAVGSRVVWNEEYYTDRWIELPQDGTYVLTFGYGTYAYTGTYSFAINSVRVPQTFAITSGTTVSNGVPVAGMGNIELPGGRDTYTFTGSSNQKLSIDRLSGSGSLRVTLRDPDNQVVLNEEYYTDQVTPLTKNGTYALTIGYGDYAYTGAYSFAMSLIPK